MNLGDPRDLRRYFAYSQVGMEMVAPIVLGLLLDLWLHWLPWGVVVGAALGLSVGLIHLIHLVNKENAESSPPQSNPREGR